MMDLELRGVDEDAAAGRRGAALEIPVETAGGGHALLALRRFGRPGAPPLLFAHANGFCASAYARTLTALGDQFDVFALDQRGHGRSRLPADPAGHRDWRIFAEDIARALAAIEARFEPNAPWTLAGHSLGGTASLMAAGDAERVRAVRLIDPVLLPFPRWLARTPLWPLFAARMPLVRGALSRRARWPSRGDALAGYRDKPLFRRWAGGVLEDYLADGVIEDETGARLACAPAWEAANFAAQGHDPWAPARAYLARPDADLSILVAERASTASRSAQRRLARLGARIDQAAGAGHLIPMERPDAVAAFLAR